MGKILPLMILLGCAAPPQDKSEIAPMWKVVGDALRAGIEKHDLNAYLSMWTEDARMIGGRDDHTFTYDLPKIRATRLLRFGAKTGGVKLHFSDIRGTVDGDEAEIHVLSLVLYAGGEEKVEETYRLRRTEDGWKVYENRWKPVEARWGTTRILYDAATLAGLDERVTKAAAIHDKRDALFNAYRFVEAYELSRKITNLRDATAIDWTVRGSLAMLTGATKDILPSFRQALQMDKNAPLPAYARAALNR